MTKLDVEASFPHAELELVRVVVNVLLEFFYEILAVAISALLTEELTSRKCKEARRS